MALQKRTKRKMPSNRSGERLATLEERSAAHDARLEAHFADDAKNQAEISAALTEIRTTLEKQRSFVAGVVFVITAIAGAIAIAVNYVMGAPK